MYTSMMRRGALVVAGVALRTVQGFYLQTTGPITSDTLVSTVPAQGTSVSLSSDGYWLAAGAPNAVDGVGATSIFERQDADTWVEMLGSPITGTGYTDFASQGTAVALSGDGYTLAVGGPDNLNGTGAVWIFNVNVSDPSLNTSQPSWAQFSPLLLPTSNTGTTPPRFGSSVDVSSDGSILAVGAPSDGDGVGSVYIYARTAGYTWTLVEGPLVGTGSSGPSAQGFSVALSYMGDVLAVGGYNNSEGTGATWVYRSVSGTWTLDPSTPLVGAGAVGNAQQGYSVSLTANGNYLAVGGPGNDEGTGAAWLFTYEERIWVQDSASPLIGVDTDNDGFPEQGTSVALSADGSVLISGAPFNVAGLGSVFAFYNTEADGWYQDPEGTNVGTNYTVTPYQGTSVALSGDGSVFASGGPADDVYRGATWVFYDQGERQVEIPPDVEPTPAPIFAPARAPTRKPSRPCNTKCQRRRKECKKRCEEHDHKCHKDGYHDKHCSKMGLKKCLKHCCKLD